MSLATWKKEFYPRAAEKTAKGSALAHSLRKWLGLTKANLEKHGCVFEYGEVKGRDDDTADYLVIGASSCALCQHHYNRDLIDDDTPPCATCPLAKALGTEGSLDEGCFKPWRAWASKRDPGPMIAALEKAIGERGKP